MNFYQLSLRVKPLPNQSLQLVLIGQTWEAGSASPKARSEGCRRVGGPRTMGFGLPWTAPCVGDEPAPLSQPVCVLLGLGWCR